MTHRRLPALVLPALLLAACGPESPPGEPEIDPVAVLGGSDGTGYARAWGPRRFEFPADHGAHPQFRHEWWYLTGNLSTAGGRRFGYQVTFFRIALAPEAIQRPSAWAARQLWMAHVAVTDAAAEKHLSDARLSREGPGLAGSTGAPFRVWLEDWQLSGSDRDFPWRVRAHSEAFGVELLLRPLGPPVLQGEDGLSRKGPDPGNASYYYSIPRLATSGELRVGDSAYAVTGLSWLDREWSTSALGSAQSGWDWFALQFDDGSDLMFYRLRRRDGTSDPLSAGSLIERDGHRTDLSADDVALQPLRWWSADDGRRFPVVWQLRLRNRKAPWRVEAVLPDQYMDHRVKYWEGAVDVIDLRSGKGIGRGYLEMTGYGRDDDSG